MKAEKIWMKLARMSVQDAQRAAREILNAISDLCKYDVRAEYPRCVA